MSSGSSDPDADEFYDAAEESDLFVDTSTPRGGAISLSEIEEEERRLLLLKKRAEERRKKEDEELERRLNQLQQRRAEADHPREHDSHAQEQDGRRRKLEEMRQSLGTDHSFFSTSHDSSIENDSPNMSADIPDIFALSGVRSVTTPKSHTIEKMENNGMVTPSYRQHAKKRSGSWGDLPKNDSELTSRAELTKKAEKVSLAGEENAALNYGAEGSISETQLLERESGAKGFSIAVAGRGGKQSDIDQNMDRFQPEKEKQSKSLTLLINGSKLTDDQTSTDSVVDTILQQTQVQEDTEPDIVKSTKFQRNTPPNMLKPPVAPPRRKKSRNLSQPTGFVTGDLPVPPSPVFARAESASSLQGATALENSLDVKSALEGSRLIHAEEAELGNSGVSPGSKQSLSPAEANIPSGSVCGQATSLPLPHGAGAYDTFDDNMDSLSVQIQHWQSLDEGGREASPNRRPRSNSGRLLSDEEILELVTVRNLDTGEMIPLSTAEDKLPKCVNPLALHIMRRTKEYSSDTSLNIEGLSDESDSRSEKSAASSSNSVYRKGVRMKKFFSRTVKQMKVVADQALHSDQLPVEEEVSVNGKVFKRFYRRTKSMDSIDGSVHGSKILPHQSSVDSGLMFLGRDRLFKIKSSSRNKGPYDFSQPNILQEMSGEHTGAIWTMKFSPCGKLLATGGQDSILRIWVLKSTYSYFEDFRQKYSDVRLSPAVSHESLNSASSDMSAAAMDPLRELNAVTDDEEQQAPFRRRPFCVYKGHTADLLDLSWSKNYFILSSSMDKTVRLWHISRRECLCTFQHIDFVTAIVFHPKDDRYFLSGSLDGKLRLWNIPDKKVTMWNELSGASTLITTANFCYNGRLAVVGTYDGKCIFYTTEQLKYYTMVNVRSTRGKNSKGRKITGIESMPGEEKILVTSNDSRIRLYNLRDLTLSCKYKGCMNNSSQIRASFSPTGKYVICGSEDHFLYIWKTNHEFLKFTSARRDRNDYWEAIKVHNAVVTSAIFAPNPSFIFRMAQQESLELKGEHVLPDDDTEEREIIVSADFTGAMKIITNRPNRT